MKKLLLLPSLIIFFLFGCQAAVQYLETDTGQAVLNRAGRIAGIFVGSNNVDRIDEMIEHCDILLSEKDETLKQAAAEAAYAYIYGKFGQTPQVMALVGEAEELIGIVMKDGRLEFLDVYNPVLLDKFVIALRNGLSLATPRHGKFIR